MLINQAERQHYKAFRNAHKSDTMESPYGDNYLTIETEYYQIYSAYLYNLLINLITYENAPVTLNQRLLEYCLRQYGYAQIGFTDPEHIFVLGDADREYGLTELGFLTSNVKVANPFSTMAEDSELPLVTHLNADTTKVGYVPLSNKFNYFIGGGIGTITDFQVCDRVSKSLAKIKAGQMRNIDLMKQQWIGFTSNKNLTSINVGQKLARGENFIQIDSDLGDLSNVVDLTNFQIQNFLPDLKDQWNNELSELLTMLGINTVGIDKKERLVAAEADANSQLTEASANIYLDARQEQLDVINTALGTNLTATFNQDAYQALVQLSMQDGYDQAEQDDKTDGDKD